MKRRKKSKPSPVEEYLIALTTEDDSVALDTASTLFDQVEQSLLETSSEDNCSDISLTRLEQRLSDDFQVLYLSADKFEVALPLVDLGGIQKLNKLSTLPGQSDLCLGILVNKREKLHCIDTAKFFKSRPANTPVDNNPDYKYAIQLQKSQYALACDRISDTQWLAKRDVKWRNLDDKQKWNAGTITSKVRILIDAIQLTEAIECSTNQ